MALLLCVLITHKLNGLPQETKKKTWPLFIKVAASSNTATEIPPGKSNPVERFGAAFQGHLPATWDPDPCASECKC